jgi:hypothetical protein
MHEDVFAAVVRLNETTTFLHVIFTMPVIIGYVLSLKSVQLIRTLQVLLFCIIQRSSRALSFARRHAVARNSACVSSVRLSSS